MNDELNSYDALLTRFRAKQEELEEAGQHPYLYAVLDRGGLTSPERHNLGKLAELEGVSLYAGSGLDSLEAAGPVLLAMPDMRDIGPLTYTDFSNGDSPVERFVSLLSLAKQHAARVTWIWTPHEADALVQHLQTLLHARLGIDGDDAWFFFYYPSHLKVLHGQLPEKTRRYVFGPIYAWWTLGVEGDLVELTGEGSEVPRACDVLFIPADVAAAIHREAMPAQVHAWLGQTRLNPEAGRSYNAQLAEIVPLIERAHGYGLSRLMDLATFVVYGLRYRVDYDLHPQIVAAVADTVSKNEPLATAYRHVTVDVWLELAQSAQQREQVRRERERYDELKKVGHIRLPCRIANASGKSLRTVYFDLHGRVGAARQYLGAAIDDGVILQKGSLLSPLPGDKLVLHWDDLEVLPTGGILRVPRDHEITVEGELPSDDHSGLLEVRFEQYVQRVVVHRNGMSLHDAGTEP